MSENPETSVVKLVWRAPHDLPTVYANQVYVTHAGGEFFIVFGEALLPAINDALPSEIEVKPVAKLVLSPQMMQQTVRVLAENFGKFEARVQEEMENLGMPPQPRDNS